MRELNHREHRLTLTALRDSALPTVDYADCVAAASAAFTRAAREAAQ
ncbi:hypothetical protein ACWDTQ_23000 [Streptomyces cellulosae]